MIRKTRFRMLARIEESESRVLQDMKPARAICSLRCWVRFSGPKPCLQSRHDPTYEVDMFEAVSGQGGNTFSQPRILHLGMFLFIRAKKGMNHVYVFGFRFMVLRDDL